MISENYLYILLKPEILTFFIIFNIVTIYLCTKYNKDNCDYELNIKTFFIQITFMMQSVFLEELFFRYFLKIYILNKIIRTLIFSFAHIQNYIIYKNIYLCIIQLLRTFVLGIYLEMVSSLKIQYILHLTFNLSSFLLSYIINIYNKLPKSYIYKVPKRRLSFSGEIKEISYLNYYYRKIYKDNPSYDIIRQLNEWYPKKYFNLF